MVTRLTKETKQELLSQILSSPEFQDSKRYSELLQYLVDKSEKVTSLKETEIAIEVFSKDSKFDPNTDPLIRSYISNLRKKLEHYYLTTDNKFDYKLVIPKGQYLVKYEEYKQNEERSVNKFNYTKFLLIPLIIFLLIVIIVQYNTSSIQKVNEVKAPNPIWEKFLQQNNLPALIILGDYLVLSEKGNPEERSFLRVPKINSRKELNYWTKEEPEKFEQYQISEVTFIGAASAVGLSKILELFGDNSRKVSIKLSSEFKWDDLENNNVVFIGSFKSLYILDTLFSRTNLKYSLNPNSLSVFNEDKAAEQTFNLNWHGGNYQKDYGVIIKKSGFKNNSIMFLTGFSEVGIMDAIKTSTDPDLSNRINKYNKSSYNEIPSYFELITEAEGLRYTVFNSKIKYFKNVSPSKN